MFRTAVSPVQDTLESSLVHDLKHKKSRKNLAVGKPREKSSSESEERKRSAPLLATRQGPWDSGFAKLVP